MHNQRRPHAFSLRIPLPAASASGSALLLLLLGSGCGGPKAETKTTPAAVSSPAVVKTESQPAKAGPALCTDAEDCARKGSDAQKAGDLGQAVLYLERSCQQANLYGCLALEGLYGEKSLPEDAAAARTLLKQGCEHGSAMACVHLGERLAEGQGGPKDLDGARAAYEKACQGNGHTSNKGACVRAGYMYLEGEGGAKDESRARELFTQGCKSKHSEGCAVLGVMKLKGQGGPSDPVAAVADFTTACEDKKDPNRVACRYAGIVYSDGAGAVSADAEKAKSMFDKGCQLGDKLSCTGAERAGRAGGDSGNGDGDAGKGGDGGKVAGANLSIGSMSANGLTVKELSCNLASFGFLGAIEIVASLAAQKSAMHKCTAGGSRPRVTWSFTGGHAKVNKVEGAPSKAAETCIRSAMSHVSSSLQGTCSAVIVLE